MNLYSTVCCDANLVIRTHFPDATEYNSVIELWDRWGAGRVTVVAPALLRYEVPNAVYRSARHGDLGDEQAGLILRSLEMFPIRYVDTFEMHEEAFAIARKLGAKISYDAHYVALPRRERAQLFTAGKKIANASKQLYPFVTYVMNE